MKKLLIIILLLFSVGTGSSGAVEMFFDPCVGGGCAETDYESKIDPADLGGRPYVLTTNQYYTTTAEASSGDGWTGYKSYWSTDQCIYVNIQYRSLSGPPISYEFRSKAAHVNSSCQTCLRATPADDTDCDGLGDDQDPFPNSSAPFTFQHIISYYNADGVLVGFMIRLEDDTTRLYGSLAPADGTLEIHPNNSPWLPSSGLADILAGSGSGNFIITSDKSQSVTSGGTPITTLATGETSSGNTTDSEHFADIVDNIYITNQNLQGLAERLERIGKSLDDIKLQNSQAGSGSGSGTGTVNVDTTALEQKIDDLVAPEGDTSYSKTTGGLSAEDTFEDDAETLGDRFGNRLEAFFTSVKSSNLFTAPFGLFTGFSGGGVSTQSINIGKWGAVTDNTVLTDLSDYNVIWDVLKSVIMLMFAYASFKIVVVKHA